MDRTELGKRPISPEKPAGEDIKYEAEFEELQGEIDKLTAISGGVPDWAKVVQLGEDILGSKSKDLKVACYLCAALLHTEGLHGLSQGISVLNDMLSSFWDEMYPPKKRLRGRIGAISWLTDRLEHYLEGMEIKEEEGADAKACREDLDELEKKLDELLGDKAPTLRPLIRLLERWPEPEVEPEAPPAPKEEEKGEEAPRAAARPVPKVSLEELTSLADIHKALREQLTALRRIAGILQGQEPRSPVAYHLLFQSIWTMIEAPPPSQDGKTRIPAPAEALVSRLKGLKEKAAWAELLKEALTRVAEIPLWLDLPRFIWVALNSQGEEWEQAAQAVQQEVRILLERVPALRDLSFADGSPLAAPATRDWLQAVVLGGGEVSEAAGVPSSEQEPAAGHPAEQVIRQAEEKALSGDFRGALELLYSNSLGASGQEESFRYRLAMARLCLESDRFSLAQPILASLAEEVDRFHLEDWQPKLAAEAIYHYYRCEQGLIKKQRPTPEQRERIKNLYSRLCRLDPVTALGVG